ncbi:MAG: PaaI family thioesterase [Lautropia sp.]
MAHLGARLADIAPGRVVIEVDFAPQLTQQHGFFHAGVTSSIADSAGGYAGFTLFPAGSSVLTVEYKMNLLNPARAPRLRAVGEVVKSGRTMTFCELKVWNVDGERVELCATGQQTLICLAGRSDAAAAATADPSS